MAPEVGSSILDSGEELDCATACYLSERNSVMWWSQITTWLQRQVQALMMPDNTPPDANELTDRPIACCKHLKC